MDISGWNISGVPYDLKDAVARAMITAQQSSLAPAFDDSTEYSTGDVVQYNGGLYQFTSGHTPGAWDAGEVTLIDVLDLLANKADTAVLEDYLPLTGGSLSGVLNTNSDVRIKDNVTIGTAPASDVWGHKLSFADSNNTEGATIREIYRASGQNQLELAVYNKYNDSSVNNALRLIAKSDGSKSVWMSDSNLWRSALFASNYSASGADLIPAATSSMAAGGYINLPLPAAYGGTGGTDSGWKTLANSGVFTGTIYYRRIGNWCYVQAWQLRLKTALTSGNRTLATIPDAAYCPASHHNPFGGAGSGTPFSGVVSTSGAITIYHIGTDIGTGNNVSFGMMYFCG